MQAHWGIYINHTVLYNATTVQKFISELTEKRNYMNVHKMEYSLPIKTVPKHHLTKYFGNKIMPQSYFSY